LIKRTIESPYTIRKATNKKTGNNAIAFYMKDGSYVVRDNVTLEVIQLSNRFDPKWVPDPSIINPYYP